MNTPNTYSLMPKVLAVLFLFIGILTFFFSMTAYAHLRTAMSGVSTDSFALRIMAFGMLEDASSNRNFLRQLETRVFIGFSFGLLLFIFGAVLLILPKPKLPEN